MHERGMADDQLIGEPERDDFAGASADPDAEAGGDVNGRAERTSAYGEGRRAAHDPARDAEFDEGRNREQ
jgi:hypothetical protein